MNSLTHILSTEKANTSHIYLYREGIFYKAYERSAYAFVTTVQKFMAKKKFFKCTNHQIHSEYGRANETRNKNIKPVS